MVGKTLINACGSMSLSEVLKPAILYAEEGFPVSDVIAVQWSTEQAKLSQLPSGEEMLLQGPTAQPRRGDGPTHIGPHSA